MVQLSCSQNHQITIKHLTIQGGGSAHAGTNLSNQGCKLRLIGSALIGSQGLGIVHQGRGTLTIKDSEVSDNDGGVIIAESKAFIINSIVTNSAGRYASAISNGGTLHLYHSTVSNNSGDLPTGGISNGGTLVVKHSSIVYNGSSRGAGGIENDGVAIIKDSLIARNTTLGVFDIRVGGGISNRGKLTLIRSTVRGNSAGCQEGCQPQTEGLGGGIYNNANVRLIDTLVTKNVAGRDGGGVFNDGGTVSQIRTLVINNTPNDCVGC
jgi:hypothetical protein